MSGADYRMTVFVNTYGNYAEGRIDDLRLDLPMDPESLYAKVAEALDIREGNDEVFLSDWDVPDYVTVTGFTDLGALNALAAIARANPDVDYGAVAAYCETAGPLEVANAILQADRIPFERWPAGTFEEWENPTEADLKREYGLKLVSEAMEDADPALAFAYAAGAFDYAAYGSDLPYPTSELGYLDMDAASDLIDGFSPAEFAEQAAQNPRAARWNADLTYAGTGLAESEADLLPAVEARVRQLYAASTVDDLEAVKCWSDFDSTPTLVELGNLLAGGVGSCFYEYDCGPLPNTRTSEGQTLALGMTVAFEAFASLGATGDRNLARELLGYIDPEKLGHERSYDLELTREGILDLADDAPDLDSYGRDELEQMAAIEMHHSDAPGPEPVHEIQEKEEER